MKRSQRPISISDKSRKPLFEFDDEPIEPQHTPQPRKISQPPIPITDETILPLVVIGIISINGIVWFVMLMFASNGTNMNYAIGAILCVPVVIVVMAIQWILVYLHYKFFWWVWIVYGLGFTLFTLFIIGVLLSGGKLPV